MVLSFIIISDALSFLCLLCVYLYFSHDFSPLCLYRYDTVYSCHVPCDLVKGFVSTEVEELHSRDYTRRPNQSWPCLVPVGGLRRLTSPAVGQLARGASAGQGTGNGLQ